MFYCQFFFYSNRTFRLAYAGTQVPYGHAGSRLRLSEDEYASLCRCSAAQLCAETKEGEASFYAISRKARQLESYVLLHDNTEDVRQQIGINCNFLTFCGPSEAENRARAACAAHAFGELGRFYVKTAPNSCLTLFF